mgnify:CR=1 FL=1
MFIIEGTVLKEYKDEGAEEIVIPEGVTKIESTVFWECENLKSVVIPETVKSIGNGAFFECYHLEKVVIPKTVTFIGGGAFEGTKWLQDYPEDLVIVGDNILIYCKCSQYYGKDIEAKEQLEIPYGVKQIAEYAFRHSLLKSITIPETVTQIHPYAFRRCSRLKEIHLPNSLSKIENWLFERCIRLKSITIPKGVTEIDTTAFMQCDNLKEIKVSEENQCYCDIDGILFDKAKTRLIFCPPAKEPSFYRIPDGVTSIEMLAFANGDTVEHIFIPESVKEIGVSAFPESLRTVTFWDGRTFTPDFQRVYNGEDEKNMYLSAGKLWDMAFQKTFDDDEKINFEAKAGFILEMFISLHDADAEAYVRNHVYDMVKYFLEIQDVEYLTKLITYMPFLNAEETDNLIETAIDTAQQTKKRDAFEIQLLLMNYKAEHIGFTNPNEKLKL